MQVVTRKANFENAVEIGDWLIEKSRENPVVIFEVRTRLEEATKPVEDLLMELSSHKNELQRLLLSEQECSEMANDLEAKLHQLEAQYSLLDPISARYTIARQQHEYFKPLFHQVQQLRHCQEALAAFHESEGGVQDEARNERVFGLTRRWQNVWHTVSNYHLQITAALPFEERHHYTMKKVLSVLSESERQLEKLQSGVLAKDNDNIEADIKKFIEDVAAKEPLLDTVNSAFVELLALLETQGIKVDVPFVKDEYDDVTKRWKILSTSTRDLLKAAKKEQQRLIEEEMTSVEETIVEAQVTETEAEPIDWNMLFSDPSYAAKIDEEELVTEKVIPRRGASLRWKAATEKVIERKSVEKDKLRQTVKFVASIDEMERFVNIITGRITSLQTPGITTEEIEAQLLDLEPLETGLARQQQKLNTTEETADWLIKHSDNQPKFVATINGKISAVKNPMHNLELMLAERKTRLKEALMNLQEFDVIAENFSGEIDNLEGQFEGLGDLNVDWNELKKQLHDVKVGLFRSNLS